jgi:hypothetical protein
LIAAKLLLQKENIMDRLKRGNPNLLHLLLISFIIVSFYCKLFKPAISVVPSTQTLEKFATLYINVQLDRHFSNPYDPQEIQVDAIITTPDSKVLTLPVFYKDLAATENSQWEARYTPVQTGRHVYYVQSISRHDNKTDTVKSNSYQLDVIESSRDGFLRLNPQSNYTLLFDSGKPFRGLGLNLCWEYEPRWGDEKYYTYKTLLDGLAANGGNFCRVWMCPWNLPLEWTKVLTYHQFMDDYQNWDKTFSHSAGLTLASGKTEFTEDDQDRVVIPPGFSGSLVYNVNEIKNFKLKLYYQASISENDIKCFSAAENQIYEPITNIEFSQTWDTYEDWHRIFVASLGELPAGTSFIKIEFNWSQPVAAHLAGILIGHETPVNVLDAAGLGCYYQKTADQLDRLLEKCQKREIYMMLTLDYHGVFKPTLDGWGSNDNWRRNPYNIANGGPCKTPQEFFINAEANRMYKNRLRYMVARWGYSTNLAIWEFWNEIDNVMTGQGVPAEDIVNWHQEMADYLKQLDPYKHLVSTSVVYSEMPGLWDINNLDITQHHNYGPTDNMQQSILDYTGRFKKPDVVGEFALGWKGPGKDHPAELYEGEFHRGMWRGFFSPTPILPMTWWWQWHYEQNHFYHFKPLAEFIALMDKYNANTPEEMTVTSTNPGVETLGLQSGGKMFYIWICNKSKKSLDKAKLSITVVTDGIYLLQRFDAWTGEWTESKEIDIKDGHLFLEDLRLKEGKDMAFFLTEALIQ